MRILATTALALAFFLLVLAACGGGNSSSSSATGGPLSGNWQLNLVQEEPRPQAVFPVSGFLLESNNALTGSVAVPIMGDDGGTVNCGGGGQLTGNLSDQNVSFSVNPGGTVLSFTGTISSDNKSMSGSYQGPGGACFADPTTGTWSAFLVPPLNGNFSGTLSDSGYMALLTGVSPPAPIAVSGTITQSSAFGSSNATLTGTITAQGYPCFTTVALTGTISGQNVVLSVFGYQNSQIGVLGTSTVPAIASLGPNGMLGISGTLALGKASATTTVGPCPPLNGGQIVDSTVAAFTFQ